MRAVALAALALLLCVTSGRAALPEAAQDDWIEARSARFVVYSNAGQRAAVEAARRLERLAQALEATTRGVRVDAGREVRVYVFKDHASFKPYRPLGDDAFGVTAGFHAVAPDAELIAYHRDSDGNAPRVAMHEYLHAVLRRTLGHIPVWANEGMAEYYSTFESKSREAAIGLPIDSHLELLRHQGMIPLRELLEIDTNDRDYHGGARRGTIYAQSWALVHMLILQNGGDASRFNALLVAYGRGASGRQGLVQAYGPGAVDSLEKRMPAYTNRMTLPFMTWKFSEDFSAVPVTTRAMSRQESVIALGELAARSSEKLGALAREHLESTWRRDSTEAVDAALLAELADRAGDRLLADRWVSAVERARAASPRAKATAGRTLAMRQFRNRFKPSFPAEGADSSAVRARALLASALATSPEQVEWLIPYGLTFVEDSTDLVPGRQALYTASELEPKRPDGIGGLGMLEVRVGNIDGAVTLYRTLPAGGPDAAWRVWVSYMLTRSIVDNAIQRFRQGQVAEAEALIARLEREVTEDGAQRAASGMREWMKNAARDAPAPDSAAVRTGAKR